MERLTPQQKSKSMETSKIKENPEYIRIENEIETIESRINSGLITNDCTLKCRNKELKRIRNELKQTIKYINGN